MQLVALVLSCNRRIGNESILSIVSYVYALEDFHNAAGSSMDDGPELRDAIRQSGPISVRYFRTYRKLLNDQKQLAGVHVAIVTVHALPLSRQLQQTLCLCMNSPRFASITHPYTQSFPPKRIKRRYLRDSTTSYCFPASTGAFNQPPPRTGVLSDECCRSSCAQHVTTTVPHHRDYTSGNRPEHCLPSTKRGDCAL